MNVLVTGAAGFVGSHLLPALAARGHTVFAVHRDPARLPSIDGVTPITWDLTAVAPPTRLPVQLDAIFHLAQANVPVLDRAAEMFAVHVAATQQLLDLARAAGARRFVLASTGSVYGGGARPWVESDSTEGAGYYAASKVAAEIHHARCDPHLRARDVWLGLLRPRRRRVTPPGRRGALLGARVAVLGAGDLCARNARTVGPTVALAHALAPPALCLVGVLPPIGFIAGVPQDQLYQARYGYMAAPFANAVLVWPLVAAAHWALRAARRPQRGRPDAA